MHLHLSFVRILYFISHYCTSHISFLVCLHPICHMSTSPQVRLSVSHKSLCLHVHMSHLISHLRQSNLSVSHKSFVGKSYLRLSACQYSISHISIYLHFICRLLISLNIGFQYIISQLVISLLLHLS